MHFKFLASASALFQSTKTVFLMYIQPTYKAEYLKEADEAKSGMNFYFCGNSRRLSLMYSRISGSCDRD